MIWLLVAFILLILGYHFYGKLLESIFDPRSGTDTPAKAQADAVDFVAMPTGRVFLIQLLNIAGIGPIFGPILGALYGPQALLWVVFGAIFAGGAHDYLCGMFSVRDRGKSIAGVVASAMGPTAGHLMSVFSIILLLLVGVIFVLSPANLLAGLTDLPVPLIVAFIFAYYFFATIVPIHLIIGRLYPLFGALLIFTTIAIFVGLLVSGKPILPNMNDWTPHHPQGLPLWPLLFIVLSCGAISGFHSTQSPLMARCLKSELHGRRVFYGAMIAEAFIALVWVTIGISFYPSAEALQAVISAGSPAAVVDEVSRSLLGPVGGVLAIIGVIILPITSGDTAFRSNRLIIAEAFNLSQLSVLNRLLISVPLFIIGIIVAQVDFQIVWRYFGWANQSLATLGLWAAAILLCKNQKARFHWIASIPATFMTAVALTYFLYSPIILNLPQTTATIAAIIGSLLCLALLMRYASTRKVRMV